MREKYKEKRPKGYWKKWYWEGGRDKVNERRRRKYLEQKLLDYENYRIQLKAEREKGSTNI